MGLDDQRKQVEALNKEIKKLYQEMGRAEMPPIFKANQLQQATDQITGLNSQLDKTRENLSFIAGSFTDAVNELTKSNKYISNTKSSLNSLAGLANTLKVEAQDLSNLSEKRLLSLEKRAKVQFETLKISKQNLDVDSVAFKEAQNALEAEKDLLDTLKQIRAEKALIDKSSGVRTFGALEGITDAVPGLKKLTPAFKAASKAAQEQAAFNLKNYGTTKGITSEMRKANKLASSKRASDLMSLKTGKGLTAAKVKELGLEKALTSSKTGRLVTGAAGAKMAKSMNLAKTLEPIQKLGKSMKPLMAGFKALGPLLKKALGPLAVIIEIFSLDKQTADLAKNMNLTYKEATRVRAEMQSIANSSDNNFVTGKKVLETFGAINKTLGTTVETMDHELLTSLTAMREMAGFTNEELQGIAAITLATGQSADDVTGEFMAQAKISATQNGVLLNEKDLLKGIKDISAATTLSFGKQPALIAEAVATAKSLGMELAKVDAIANSLLNFEDSITNELQAELLLNKDLSLEKARQAALNNDLATVAEEIANQAGTAAEFSESNRFEQEALASAVGMSREELASSLFLREQLQGLSSKAAEQAEADFQRRVAEVGLAQAQRELEQEGVEGLRQQVGMADRMVAAMDKLNEVFVSLIEPLMPILDIFVALFGLVGKIVALVKPLLDAASFVGNLIGDSIGSVVGGVGSMLEGGSFSEGVDFSGTAASGKRLQDDNWLGKGVQMLGAPTAFAKGGIVTGPTNAIIGEAGPEAVIPLSGNTPSLVDMSSTNALLEKLVKKTPEMAPLGLYEVQ